MFRQLIRSALKRSWLGIATTLFAAIFSTPLNAQQSIACYGEEIGILDFWLVDGGLNGIFTATFDFDGDGISTLSEAAGQCEADHFNWYQIVVADSNPPNDMFGNPLTPPYVDPPPGGIPPLETDFLPWYMDEGPGDMPLHDAIAQVGGQEILIFSDYPWDAAGTVVDFNTWLVALTPESTPVKHFPGKSWRWQAVATPGGGLAGVSSGLTSIPPPTKDQRDLAKKFPGLVPADLDGDGDADHADIDRLSTEIYQQNHDPAFDFNSDGYVTQQDYQVWAKHFKNTWFGDADLNGVFEAQDLVRVFAVGEYEDGIPQNSTWGDGDWNGDLEFDSSDLVVAFADGGYELGLSPAAAVPEPSAALLAMFALISIPALRVARAGRARIEARANANVV